MYTDGTGMHAISVTPDVRCAKLHGCMHVGTWSLERESCTISIQDTSNGIVCVYQLSNIPAVSLLLYDPRVYVAWRAGGEARAPITYHFGTG